MTRVLTSNIKFSLEFIAIEKKIKIGSLEGPCRPFVAFVTNSLLIFFFLPNFSGPP